MRRRLAVLTTGRQDFGILRGTLHALAAHSAFELRLWVGGMHLSTAYGETWREIEADGLPIARRLDFLGPDDSPIADAATALRQVGEALEAEQPEALLLLGDRSETLAAGVAATLARVAVVHLHGGEETEGAVDNACRHALTKLSHLHLVSHPLHAARVRQMGEEPSSVVVVGAPGLDHLYRDDLPDAVALTTRLGRPLRQPLALVTVHPATLGSDEPLAEVDALIRALDGWPGTIVVTQPNADAGGAAIRRRWLDWAAMHPDHAVVDALGADGYWGMLRLAAVVAGNSSSGLIEAPAAGVPVVNIGDRQAGRLRTGLVFDVPADAAAISDALARARAAGRQPPGASGYPAGPAVPRIIAALEAWRAPSPPRKRFHAA